MEILYGLGQQDVHVNLAAGGINRLYRFQHHLVPRQRNEARAARLRREKVRATVSGLNTTPLACPVLPANPLVWG